MKKRMTLAVLVLSLVIGTISYGPLSRTAATTSDDLETQQEEVDEEIRKLKEQLGDSNSELDHISSDVVEIEHNIESTEKEIKKLNQKLEEVQKSADRQYEDMKLRIQYMYENEEQSSWVYFLQAKSLSDLINRVEYVSQVTKRDRELAQEYADTLSQIKEYKTALEEKQKVLVAKKEELKKKQDTLLTSINSLSSNLDEQEQLSDEIAQQLEEIREEERKMKEEEARKANIEEERRKAKELEEELRRKREEEEKKRQEEQEDPQDEDPQNPNPAPEPSESEYIIPVQSGELELFAALLFCEAGDRRYPDAMRYAVASVVVNRVQSSGFPNSLTSVIYQSGQFSPTFHVISKFNMTYLAAVLNGHYWTADDRAHCMGIVKSVLKGNITGNWLYFRYDPEGKREGEHIGTEVFY